MIESIKDIAKQTKEQIVEKAQQSASMKFVLQSMYDEAYAKGVLEQRDFTDKLNNSLLSIIAEHVENAFRDFEVARATNGVGHDDNQKWLLVWSELDEVLRDCREAAGKETK